STWLHAVLAQRHVDIVLSGAKVVSIDSESELESPDGRRDEGPLPGRARHANPAPPDPDRELYVSRLGDALCEALAALPARERMILACYYVDALKLAEIGRMLGEHESTISRQLDRMRRALRERVAAILRRGPGKPDGSPSESGLDDAQIERAFEYALEDWPFDLTGALSKEAARKPRE
ncbi:MAG: RNA polymerase sigma factor, partial [Candidatus Acidiferrales bacterium]